MKWIVLFIYLISQLAYTQEIVVTEKLIEIDEKTRDAWRTDFFQGDEVIPISNAKLMFEKMEEVHGPSKEINFLKSKLKTKISDEIGTIYSLYSDVVTTDGGFIILSPKEKMRFPSKILNDLYRESVSYGYRIPKYKSDKKDLYKLVDSWTTDKSMKKFLKEMIVQASNQVFLPITPRIWNVIPADVKDEVIDKYYNLESSTSKRAVDIDYIVRSETEVDKLIEKYSLPEEQDIFKTRLKKLLAASSNSEIRLPLKTILPAIIRDKLNSFDLKGGPNCFNSSDCVNQLDDYKTKYLPTGGLRETLKNTYDKISLFDEPKSGDLMLLSDAAGNEVHAATYIDEDTVFTKNGITRFSPYIFQKTDDMEKAYFGEEARGFGIQYYRKKPEFRNRRIPLGEEPPACSGKVIKGLTN